MIILGIVISGLCGVLPILTIAQIPIFLRVVLFIVGIMISFVGYFLVWTRADKTGAKHIIEPAKRGESLWFYAYRDDTILITPGIRTVESQLYSPEIDAQIQDYKSYRLFDHSIRFVPEGVGHAIDLGMCLYVKLLKGKHGFERIEDARETAKKLELKNPIAGKKHYIIPQEGIITEQILQKADELIKEGESLG